MNANVSASASIRRSTRSPSTRPPPRFDRKTHAASPWLRGVRSLSGLAAKASPITVFSAERRNRSDPPPAPFVLEESLVGEYLGSICAIGYRFAPTSVPRRVAHTRRCRRIGAREDLRGSNRWHLDSPARQGHPSGRSAAARTIPRGTRAPAALRRSFRRQ